MSKGVKQNSLPHYLIGSVAVMAIWFLAVTYSSSQIRFRVAGGMSTDWIINNNPATYRITGSTMDPTDSTQPYGGGFDGVQMGWGIKGFMDIDKQKRFRIPVGVDYFIFTGAQSFGANIYRISARNDVKLYTGILGFEWSFVEFPMAFARAYVGTEARLLFVSPNEYTLSIKFPDRVIVETVSHKPAATRLGGMVRLGLEGEIYYPVFINTSIAWGVMNLIGRDQVPGTDGGRGELLTVKNDHEGAESIVQHVNFTFMIQVRL